MLQQSNIRISRAMRSAVFRNFLAEVSNAHYVRMYRPVIAMNFAGHKSRATPGSFYCAKRNI